jgi:uncharacterized membrane protein YgcG
MVEFFLIVTVIALVVTFIVFYMTFRRQESRINDLLSEMRSDSARARSALDLADSKRLEATRRSDATINSLKKEKDHLQEELDFVVARAKAASVDITRPAPLPPAPPVKPTYADPPIRTSTPARPSTTRATRTAAPASVSQLRSASPAPTYTPSSSSSSYDSTPSPSFDWGSSSSSSSSSSSDYSSSSSSSSSYDSGSSSSSSDSGGSSGGGGSSDSWLAREKLLAGFSF